MQDGTAAPDHFNNGIPYDADGALASDFASAMSHYHQGLPFTAAGRLVAKTGLLGFYGSGAAPFIDAETLLIEEAVAVIWSGGVGYTSAGAIAIAAVKPTSAVTNNGVEVTNNGEVVTNG